MSDPITLFYVVIVLLLATLYVSKRLVNSPFGKVAIACRDNETRLTCIGVDPLPYKLLMFVISGGITALSGALLANLTSFINPGYASWIVSGELLVMVILGAVATLIGPIIGAVVFVGFEHALSDITEHWMLIFGLLIIIRVLFMKNGIYGLFQNKRSPVSENKLNANRKGATQ